MTLMFWREYRTNVHIAQSYGLSEAAVCRTTIRAVEDALVRCGEFTPKGKKVLTQSDIIIGVVVDASEYPVEHPQKAEALLQRQ